jgi:hypothetical protein
MQSGTRELCSNRRSNDNVDEKSCVYSANPTILSFPESCHFEEREIPHNQLSHIYNEISLSLKRRDEMTTFTRKVILTPATQRLPTLSQFIKNTQNL